MSPVGHQDFNGKAGPGPLSLLQLNVLDPRSPISVTPSGPMVARPCWSAETWKRAARIQPFGSSSAVQAKISGFHVTFSRLLLLEPSTAARAARESVDGNADTFLGCRNLAGLMSASLLRTPAFPACHCDRIHTHSAFSAACPVACCLYRVRRILRSPSSDQWNARRERRMPFIVEPIESRRPVARRSTVMFAVRSGVRLRLVNS